MTGRGYLVFLLIAASLVGLPSTNEATFFGEPETNLHFVASGKYGYSLYVPTDYSPDHKWPLIIALSDETVLGEEYILGWLEAARKRGFLVFSPNYPVPREYPHKTDKWLLKHKETIESQYAVDPSRILITGSGFGGHYALYLGLRYPKEFSAVASIGNATRGKFQKLFVFPYAKAHRLPVLILKGSESETDTEGTADLETIRSKGYAVETVEAESAQAWSASNASPYILDWFERVSLERENSLQNRSWGLKERFFQWLDDLVRNP